MEIKIISLGTTAEQRSEATIQAFETGDLSYISTFEYKKELVIKEAIPYEAYCSKRSALTHFLTKSTKKNNTWQLTTFNKKMLPLSDSEFSDKQKALEELVKNSDEEIEAIII